MQENRDTSFDAFRGLAIIAVVAIHAIYLGGSPYSGGFLYYRQLLNFCVPALFFVSGYWAAKESISSLADYKTFLVKKLLRILVPYLFWSFIWIGCLAVKTRDISGGRIVYLLLTGGACTGYYFVIAIAQLYVLTPLLQYMNRKWRGYGLIMVLVFHMACLLVLYFSRLLNIIWHFPAALPFYSWIIYYEMGLFWRGHSDRIMSRQKTLLFHFFVLFATVASLLISMIEGMVIFSKYNNPEFAAFSTKYSSVLYSVCIILAFISYREYFGRLPQLLMTMGRHSFGVYLIHAIVLGWVVKIFSGFGIVHSFQPLHQLVIVATTLLICLVLIVAVRSTLPRFIYGKLLGF